MIRTAKLSVCQRYRYSLTRIWDDKGGAVLFVMLNPSKADGSVDDPTIRKCIGFARGWGFAEIRVANLFAYRATDPVDLRRAQKSGEDIVGPQNIEHVLALTHGAGRVIMAWGAHAHSWAPYAQQVTNRLRTAALLSGPLLCFGTSKQGQPVAPVDAGLFDTTSGDEGRRLMAWTQEKQRAYAKLWRERNREKTRAYLKRWNELNRDRAPASTRR